VKKRLVGTGARAPADKRGGALSLAALAFSGAAQAITLGDAQVRSALGQPLEARIPVSAATGESMRGACFSLAPHGNAGAPALTDAELALRRSAHGSYLEIRSRRPATQPDVLVSVAVACPGGAPRAMRDFVLLLEPPVRATPPKVAGDLALRAREGDTLESIAAKIVPEPSARAGYLRALREANPGLAARGDDALIDAHESIALPDLRTYARSSHRAPGIAAAAATAPRREARTAGPKAPTRPDVTAQAPAAPAATAPKRKPAAASRAPSIAHAAADAQPFQLKLSAPEIDLSASRNIGERERAQLRERLAMLDADDQVAAMLSLRHSLKQLEARVAELQLKLATMSPGLEQRSAKASEAPSASPSPAPVMPPPQVASTAPAKPAVTPPAAATPATPATAPASSASPASPAAPSPPATVPPLPPSAASAASKPTPPASAPEKTQAPAAEKSPSARNAPSTPSTEQAPSVAPPPAQIDTSKLHRPRVAVAASEGSALRFWLWLAGGAIALGVLVALLVRWRRRASEEAWLDQPETAPPAGDEIAPATPGERPVDADAPRIAESDADLPTRLPTTDAEELRRRYMRERFPELATGMVSLDDAASVVKAARLLYEDGAAPRAVELLQFALETHPEELRHWLALFEIYRLERLTGEFASLAQRFHERFGETEHWHKVRYFGREIDSGNALYQDVVDKLSTIGPRESRRLAAAASFDPLAENWLNAPMDFENEVLANELRNALMQKASVSEQDLQANPMPALRNVEMFTVA